MCRSDTGGEVRGRSKCSGVDKDEETTMFGERTGESDANLYPANWKQRSPAPEPHSRSCGLCGPGPGRRGRVMRAVGWKDGK